jgi:hypothetical protein
MKGVLTLHQHTNNNDMEDYKGHLFRSLGNNQLDPNRTQCGRRMWANSKGAMMFKSRAFLQFAQSVDETHVCKNCMAWYKINKMGA